MSKESSVEEVCYDHMLKDWLLFRPAPPDRSSMLLMASKDLRGGISPLEYEKDDLRGLLEKPSSLSLLSAFFLGGSR